MSTQLTFECGRCASTYSISQDDLGQAGAKITCPKCYTFFYLKPSSAEVKSPIIEKIAAKDGEYQDTSPPPIPGEKTTEKILTEAIESLSYAAIKDDEPVHQKKPAQKPIAPAIPKETPKVEASTASEQPKVEEPDPIQEFNDSLIEHHVPTSVESDLSKKDQTVEKQDNLEAMWNKDLEIEHEMLDLPDDPSSSEKSSMNLGLEEVTGNFYDPETVITQDSLSDYPEEPPETSADRSIIWLAGIVLTLCAVFFAHYNRSLTLPFITGFQKPLPVKKIPLENQKLDVPVANDAKYGFPEVEDIDDSEIVNSDQGAVYDEAEAVAAPPKN